MGIRDTIPASLTDGTVQYPAQDPSSGTPGVIVPPQVLQVLMRTSTALTPKPSAPPPHPQVSQVLAGIPLGYQFAFNQLMSPTPYGNVISAYRIYRNKTANSFSGSTLIRTIIHDPTHQGAVTVQDQTSGNQTYYYFVTAVDSTGQESSSPGSFQSSPVISGAANPNALNAQGSTNNPSTTSASYVVVPEMTVTLTTHGNKVLIVFTGSFNVTTTSTTVATTGEFAIFKDGVQLSPGPGYFISNGLNVSTGVPDSGVNIPVGLSFIDQPTAASHTYDVRWAIFNGPGTLNGVGLARTLQVVELG